MQCCVWSLVFYYYYFLRIHPFLIIMLVFRVMSNAKEKNNFHLPYYTTYKLP